MGQSSSSPFKTSDVFINSSMLASVYSSHPLSNYALVNTRANASNNPAEFLSNPLSLSDLNSNNNNHNTLNSSNNLVLSGPAGVGVGVKASSELNQFKFDLGQKMYLDNHGQAKAMAAAVNANIIAAQQNAAAATAAANLHMLKSNNYHQATTSTTPTSLMQPLFYFQQQLQPNQYHVQAQQYEQQQQQQQQQYQQKFQYQHQPKQVKIINASSRPITGTASNLVNNDFLNSVKSLKDIKKTQLHFKPY